MVYFLSSKSPQIAQNRVVSGFLSSKSPKTRGFLNFSQDLYGVTLDCIKIYFLPWLYGWRNTRHVWQPR